MSLLRDPYVPNMYQINVIWYCHYFLDMTGVGPAMEPRDHVEIYSSGLELWFVRTNEYDDEKICKPISCAEEVYDIDSTEMSDFYEYG